MVQDMVTPVILGADFWARFGEFLIYVVYHYSRAAESEGPGGGEVKVQSLNLSVELFNSVGNCKAGTRGALR